MSDIPVYREVCVYPGERELFRNRQWIVTTHSVETIDQSLDYWFAIKRADNITPEPFGWPVHMADKEWCDIDAFCEAWLVALTVLGIKTEKAGAVIARAKAKRADLDERRVIRAELFPRRRFQRQRPSEWVKEEAAVTAEITRRRAALEAA
jgi:hypothetical protein